MWKSASRTATEKPVDAAGEVEVEQSDVGVMGFGRRDRAVGVVGDRHDPVARIVLDQIFERRGELRVIFDNQDLKHRELSLSTAAPAGP